MNYKRKFSLKNEINYSKDSPLSIINQNMKKRKNDIDNNNFNKKVFNII